MSTYGAPLAGLVVLDKVESAYLLHTITRVLSSYSNHCKNNYAKVPTRKVVSYQVLDLVPWEDFTKLSQMVSYSSIVPTLPDAPKCSFIRTRNR